MRFSLCSAVRSAVVLSSSLIVPTQAVEVLKASSLVTCMDNSLISASDFDVSFYPENRTVNFEASANVEIDGYVKADITVVAYGFNVINEVLDPCSSSWNLPQLCPLFSGQVDIQSNTQVSESVVSRIPGVAFTVPDIDASVFIKIMANSTGNSTVNLTTTVAPTEYNDMVACIRADFTNTKTVNHVGVKWATAVISGIGLLTSAVASSFGNSYAAAHVATNAVSLFSYFQSVVIITMEAVDKVPPIASSWGQNLAWSVGLIEVNFMQEIYRWYVQATGGNPTLYITQPTISILVQKRDVIAARITEYLELRPLLKEVSTAAYYSTRNFVRGASNLVRRSSSSDQITDVAESSSTLLVLRGILRVGYEAKIEQTSIVLTSFTFFVLICLVMFLIFGILRLILIPFFKDKYDFFRNSWLSLLRGTILRLTFIAFPQLLVFSLWEFIERDSPAVIVLAVFFLLASVGIMIRSSLRVYQLGRQSLHNYGTPAYLLYSDGETMNKYGFLYIQFDASRYYFMFPILTYTFVKACFISFAQSSGKTQGMALFLIELAYLVLVSWKKPYMDKSTNVIYIIICSINFVNALFFLFFSNLFGQPAPVASIMGVLFFIINAAFSLVLLIYTLVTCGLVLFSKNPDTRYRPADDDRASFIQESGKQPAASAAGEFTALGAAARADHDDSLLGTPEPGSQMSFGGDEFSFNEKRASANTYNMSNVPYDSAGGSMYGSDAGSQILGGGTHYRSDSETGLQDSTGRNKKWSNVFSRAPYHK
jgi:hypothetical protein